MNFNEYQEATKKTAIYPSDKALEYLSLGLASEAGEVAGKIKKIIRDSDSKLSKDHVDAISGELGDVLWYVAQLADFAGLSLEAVAAGNIDKLLSRYERGAIGGSGDNR